MRILTWNIQHGGGPRIDRIHEAMRPYEADVVVLSEYRNNERGADLRARMKADGLSTVRRSRRLLLMATPCSWRPASPSRP